MMADAKSNASGDRGVKQHEYIVGQLKIMRQCVTKFYKETLNGHFTEHFVYWWKLLEEFDAYLADGHTCTDECKKFGLCYKEYIRREVAVKCATPLGSQLATELEVANKLWNDIADVGTIQFLREESKNLSANERRLYLLLDELLFTCQDKDVAFQRTMERPFPIASPNSKPDTLLEEAKFFWFRYFGMQYAEQDILAFGRALCLYLQIDYSDGKLVEELFEKVMAAVIDSDGSSSIDPEEWTYFIYRYGPIRDCFNRAKSVCTNKGELCNWFKHEIGRQEAERILMNGENNDDKSVWIPKFLIRPGKANDTRHAFTMSYITPRGRAHIKISIETDESSSPEKRVYHAQGLGRFDNVRLLATHACRKLGFVSDSPKLAIEEALWRETEKKNVEANNFDDSSFVQSLKALFNVPDSVIPKAVELSEKDEAEITDILAAPDALAKLQAFCEAKGVGHTEASRRRNALQNYHPKATGQFLVHEVVQRALKDPAWVDLIGALSKAGVKLNQRSSAQETPLGLAAASSSEHAKSVLEALIQHGKGDITEEDLHQLFEKAVSEFNVGLCEALLSSKQINMADVLRSKAGKRNIFHFIAAETNPYSDEDEDLPEMDDDDEPEEKQEQELTEKEKCEALNEIVRLLFEELFHGSQYGVMRNVTSPMEESHTVALNKVEKAFPFRSGTFKRKEVNKLLSRGTAVDEKHQRDPQETPRSRGSKIDPAELLEASWRDSTPIMLAAKKGNRCVVTQLREKCGSRLDVVDGEGFTVLHHIVMNGFQRYELEEIERLFSGAHSLRVKLNARSKVENISALAVLLQQHEEETSLEDKDRLERVIVVALEQGASLSSLSGLPQSQSANLEADLSRLLFRRMEYSDVHRWTVPRNAVVNGDAGLVEMLLRPAEKWDVLPYLINPYFRPGTKKMTVQEAEENLERAEVTYRDHEDYLLSTEQSLLHLAVSSSRANIHIVEMILEHAPSDDHLRAAAKLRRRNKKQKKKDEEEEHKAKAPPLARYRSRSMEDLLRAQQTQAEEKHPRPDYDKCIACMKGDINFLDENGQSALHLVSQATRVTATNTQIATALFGKKINIVKKDKFGHTALHHAAFNNQLDIVDMLIKAHANVEEITGTTQDAQSDERTALHLAALRGHWQTCSSLLKNGASVDTLDRAGFTPLALCMERKQFLNQRFPSAITDPPVSNTHPVTIKEDRDEWKSQDPAGVDTQISGGVHPIEMEVKLGHTVRRASAQSAQLSIPDIDEAPVRGPRASMSLVAAQEHLLSKLVGRNPAEQQQLLREELDQYDICINVLLNYGASISTATESCAKELDALMDISKRWNDIQNEINTLEDKRYDIEKQAYETTDAGERERTMKKKLVINQKKLAVFSNKTNQIVINHVYQKLIKKKHAARLVRYVVFLVLITCLGIFETTRDNQSAFFFHNALKSTLAEGEYDFNVSRLERDFMGIDAKDEFWMFIKGPVTELLYPSEPITYWEGNTALLRGNGIAGTQSRVIGLPRLRQIRSKTISCGINPSELKSLSPVCFSSVVNEEDKEPFGFAGLTFNWQSSADLKGVWNWGRAAWYWGSGYVYNFPAPSAANRNLHLSLAQTLEDNNWIDPKTRVVYLEMTLHNPNQNHFMYVTMQVEFPLVGGVVPSYEFQVVKLQRYTTNGDYGVLALEIIVLIAMLFHLYGEILQMRFFKLDYLNSMYNVMDVCIIVVFTIVLCIHITTLSWESEIDWDTQTEMPPTQRIARWIVIESDLLSLLVLLVWVKLVDYLSIFRKFSRLVVMIEMMLRQLVSFLSLFMVALAAFSLAEYIAYGYKDPQGYTVLFGFISRISQTFSGREIDNVTTTDRVVGTLYALLFIVFTSLLLLNLIIAIMTSAYEEARAETGERFWATRQYDYIVTAHPETYVTRKINDGLHALYAVLSTTLSDAVDSCQLRVLKRTSRPLVKYPQDEEAAGKQPSDSGKQPPLPPMDH